MPTNSDFGKDLPEHYGTLTYYDDHGIYHEEKYQQLTETMQEFMMVSMIVLFMVRNKSSNHGKQFYKWKC